MFSEAETCQSCGEQGTLNSFLQLSNFQASLPTLSPFFLEKLWLRVAGDGKSKACPGELFISVEGRETLPLR